MHICPTLACASAHPKTPARERRPGAQHQVADQPGVIQLHLQAAPPVREAERKHLACTQEAPRKVATQHQRVRVMHLEQFCMREQKHAQPVPSAKLTKRRVRQVANAETQPLAPSALAHVDVEFGVEESLSRE